jgi:BetI-type transcriptional repressor, C-terminal
MMTTTCRILPTPDAAAAVWLAGLVLLAWLGWLVVLAWPVQPARLVTARLSTSVLPMAVALPRRPADRTSRDPDLIALRAEFWLYAVRNPEAMGALRAQQRQQADALIGVISAAMERWNTHPGVPPADVAAVVLAMFQGLVRQRRIDPDRVSGDLFAHGLRWLFGGLGSAPPGGER